jgi:glutamate 2,3-aminomutase
MNCSKKDSRQISLERAEILKSRIDPYLDAKRMIPAGLEQQEIIKARQERIKAGLGATEAEWNDWHWQIKRRITDSDTLAKFIKLTPKQKQDIDAVAAKFRWAVSPYFLSLIDPEGDHYKDPIFLQSIPTGLELKEGIASADPMAEEFTNPAPCVTRRYPDRLIINVTNQCGMYCRHCQRRRNIGEVDSPQPKEKLQQAIEYIRNTPEIRDVLVTGGDPFTLSDEMLDWLLGELDSIPHLEFKRIGTRMPVTLPQRVTPQLCDMLKKHHPLFINLQFNNPIEVSAESKTACEMLADAGIPLGNQTVLLRGVNDDPYIMKKLCQDLLRLRVKPYYIFHAKGVVGTLHFRTSVDIGIEIMEHLRGYTSGLAIPTFIINAPEGRGKTPMLPEYVISHGRDTITIRTWEGQIITYPNKDAEVEYE